MLKTTLGPGKSFQLSRDLTDDRRAGFDWPGESLTLEMSQSNRALLNNIGCSAAWTQAIYRRAVFDGRAMSFINVGNESNSALINNRLLLRLRHHVSPCQITGVQF